MTDPATEHRDPAAAAGVEPGRPVRLEPTPAGLWRILLGVGVAALAPLFGFLIGGTLGAAEEGANDPMFVALFIGIVVGGVGVIVALTGGMRMWRNAHEKDLAEAEAEAEAAATSETTSAS